MKIVSLTVLHYGREWLEWALRSVYQVMDEMHIFYTPHPSHGHSTKARCPDSREELYGIGEMFPNVAWHDTEGLYYEGQHRDYARHVCIDAGADVILVLDADEVWDIDDLERAIVLQPGLWKSRVKGHLWKGVNWVCRDACMPDRVIVPGSNEPRYLDSLGFWHFGYAISMISMIYKLRIHGHHNELKPRWYPEVYRDWKSPADTPECGVHPTCGCDDRTGKPFWAPEPFDRYEIEHLVGDHPIFNEPYV